MPRRYWTPERLGRLKVLRLTERRSWDEIGEAFGLSWQKCRAAFKYHGYRHRAVVARLRNRDVMPINYGSPIGGPGVVADRVPADLAAPAAVAPSGRARRISLVDAHVLARVAAQGITAGLLGDPPAGRSALDKRRSR